MNTKDREQAATRPPGSRSTTPGRETQERDAALKRSTHSDEWDFAPCAPPLYGVPADQLFTLLAANVRDYAIFLIDADGIIRCWGEGARLMKW